MGARGDGSCPGVLAALCARTKVNKFTLQKWRIIMAHKKGKFLNFCFSCIPGAGQMYQGFMKRGVSIMVVFFGMLALISYFGIDELIFCLPIIWFYGFFDGIHLNSLPDSEYAQLRDEFLFMSDELPQLRLKKLRVPAAVTLILLGGYGLFRTIINYMIWEELLFWDSPAARLIYDLLPKMLFSVLIIFIGVYLIAGKKKEMEDEDYEEDGFYQGARSYTVSGLSDEMKNSVFTENVQETAERSDEGAELESVLIPEGSQPEEERG